MGTGFRKRSCSSKMSGQRRDSIQPDSALMSEASHSPDRRKASEPLPLTVLTGFLGAGKTTLLNRLLKDEALSQTAVIINEFGEIALDHLLVEYVGEDRKH